MKEKVEGNMSSQEHEQGKENKDEMKIGRWTLNFHKGFPGIIPSIMVETGTYDKFIPKDIAKELLDATENLVDDAGKEDYSHPWGQLNSLAHAREGLNDPMARDIIRGLRQECKKALAIDEERYQKLLAWCKQHRSTELTALYEK